MAVVWKLLFLCICSLPSVSAVSAPAGAWRELPSMGVTLGEVSSAILENQLIVVGQSHGHTMLMDLSTESWSEGTQRPFRGNHHAVATPNDGNMWLFGGFGRNSVRSMIQVYNPRNDSWRAFRAPKGLVRGGAMCAAALGSRIVVCGGIFTNVTQGDCSLYNIATGRVTRLPTMPIPVNHVACGTDGKRVYYFGGRGGDNEPGLGYSIVQILHVPSSKWQTSSSHPSIPPLPAPRGGMGPAVFIEGEFYIIAGETLSERIPYGVHRRVDVYNVATKTWRRLDDLPVGMHGISPCALHGNIYLAGGGIELGYSSSDIGFVWEPLSQENAMGTTFAPAPATALSAPPTRKTLPGVLGVMTVSTLAAPNLLPSKP